MSLLKEAKSLASGSGIVCQVQLFGAFEVPGVAGVSARDRTFLTSSFAGPEAQKARDGALALAKQHNHKNADGSWRVQQTLCLVQYRDTVLGREVNWRDDQFETYGPNWGSDYKKAIEIYTELGLDGGKKAWVRMGAIASPNAAANIDSPWAQAKDRDGNVMTDADGNPLPLFMRVPREVFASKEEAESAAALALMEEADGDESFPGGAWTPESWNEMKPTIREQFEEMNLPKAIAYKKLAEDFEATESAIKLVIEEA